MGSVLRTVGFVGAGRTASALAVALGRCGYTVSAVASRSLGPARLLADKVHATAVRSPSTVVRRCDVVFLTVPDDAIAAVAAGLPWRQGQAAVHCSGALSLEALAEAGRRGALVGSLHPMQTFPGGEDDPDRLEGVTFAIEGTGALREWLEGAVLRLRGHALFLRAEDRPLYHASGIMCCGFVTAVVDLASSLWEPLGFSQEQGVRALGPLLEATVRSIVAQGPRKAATGPIARGDVGTVRRHLEVFAARAPQALALYCQAGLRLVAMVREAGTLSQERAQELEGLLASYLPEVREAAAPVASGRR
ncbi:MAG: DUF2520 domain-containing protein [Chloroflexi bacterium]|nr:DUF2520 domain-containing protein [Chloroflexota bacterium]